MRLLFLLAAAPLFAQPTVDQVLEKYIGAIGGRAAIESIKTRVMKGTADEKRPFEVYAKAPNKLLVVDGSVRAGFNGSVAWRQQGGEVADLPAYPRRDADFYWPLTLKQLFPNVDYSGKEKIGGREVYCLEAPRGGIPKRWCFDTESGLLNRMEVTEYDGKVISREDYSDYRRVAGLLVPFVVRRTELGVESVVRFVEVKLGGGLEDSVFERPLEKKI